MKNLQKNNKSELSDYIKQAVLTLALPPGLSIDETQLSDMFSISRTPIREVLRQLVGDGYLELHENRGVRVSELSHVTLRNFFLVAPMIYSAVLRLAAQNAKPDQIKELEKAQKSFRMANTNGSVADRATANNNFHEITGRMADNIFLLPSFRRLLIDHARIAMTFYQLDNPSYGENMSRSEEHHDKMIEAIQAKDGDRASELADAHWALSRGKIESFVTPKGLSYSLKDYISEQQRVK